MFSYMFSCVLFLIEKAYMILKKLLLVHYSKKFYHDECWISFKF